MTTALLGADYANGDWLLGLALSQSAAEGGYADPEAGSGKLDASLTAAIPYASVRASERLKLWGAAGVGAGEVTMTPETSVDAPQAGPAMRADIDWRMAAVGARGLLLTLSEGEGPALALTSDALWARTSSQRTRDMAASASDVTRLRLGLEGSWTFALEDGGHLTPKLEAGARHDGGDAETGFGVELGAGLAWSDPRLGLSLDIEGRTLVAHEDGGLEDRGFAASLAYRPTRRRSAVRR